MRRVAVNGMKLWGVGFLGSGLLHGVAAVVDQRDRGHEMTTKAFMQGYQVGCFKAAVIPPVLVISALLKVAEKVNGKDR